MSSVLLLINNFKFPNTGEEHLKKADEQIIYYSDLLNIKVSNFAVPM